MTQIMHDLWHRVVPMLALALLIAISITKLSRYFG